METTMTAFNADVFGALEDLFDAHSTDRSHHVAARSSSNAGGKEVLATSLASEKEAIITHTGNDYEANNSKESGSESDSDGDDDEEDFELDYNQLSLNAKVEKKEDYKRARMFMAGTLINLGFQLAGSAVTLGIVGLSVAAAQSRRVVTLLLAI